MCGAPPWHRRPAFLAQLADGFPQRGELPRSGWGCCFDLVQGRAQITVERIQRAAEILDIPVASRSRRIRSGATCCLNLAMSLSFSVWSSAARCIRSTVIWRGPGRDQKQQPQPDRAAHHAAGSHRQAAQKEMLGGDATARAAHADKLAEFQRALFADVRQTFQTLQNQDDRAPLRAEDLPAALRHRFVGISGKFLLQIYPNTTCGSAPIRKNLSPICGPLIQTSRHAGATLRIHTLLKNSYETAAWYSLARLRFWSSSTSAV